MFNMKLDHDVKISFCYRYFSFCLTQSYRLKIPQGGHSVLKNTGGGAAGFIVWGLGFWLGKDILGFFKNIDLDNS